MNFPSQSNTIFLHVHDEAIAEIPLENAKEHYSNMIKAMEKVPHWASDFPLKADGYITPFYLKD